MYTSNQALKRQIRNNSNNLNVEGDTLVTDLLATNIDVSNNLNVEGLITGVAETTFVEYRDYTQDIC